MEQYIGVDLHHQVFHACESTVRSDSVRQLQRRGSSRTTATPDASPPFNSLRDR
jgi:hypothetical protein